MQNNKTQQFAKFFIKDIKNKSSKNQDNKSTLDNLNYSSAI